MKVYYKRYRIKEGTLVGTAFGFAHIPSDVVTEIGSTVLPPEGRHYVNVKGLGIICVQGSDLEAIDNEVTIKHEEMLKYHSMHEPPDNYHM